MCLLYLLLHDVKTTKSGNVVDIGLHLETYQKREKKTKNSVMKQKNDIKRFSVSLQAAFFWTQKHHQITNILLQRKGSNVLIKCTIKDMLI